MNKYKGLIKALEMANRGVNDANFEKAYAKYGKFTLRDKIGRAVILLTSAEKEVVDLEKYNCTLWLKGSLDKDTYVNILWHFQGSYVCTRSTPENANERHDGYYYKILGTYEETLNNRNLLKKVAFRLYKIQNKIIEYDILDDDD